MKRTTFLFLLAALLIPLSASRLLSVDLKKGSHAPGAPGTSGLSVSIELRGEKGDVFRPGSEIGVSFETTEDAYVVIYNVDSDGYVHLLYPEDGRPVLSEGRKTHFLPEPGTGVYWEAGGRTGIEYIHAIAVDDEARLDEDELYFLSQNDRISEDKRFRIDLDPFLAFNMIDEELVRDAETVSLATDHTYFYINRHVDYPRYLCAKCHSPEKLPDPYAMECPEIVIEKLSYDEDPGYPYPPLYDVRHVGAAGDEDDGEDYASESYGERWLEDEDDDTDVALSFSFGRYDYPFGVWPYYGGFYTRYYPYPFSYDPFWWSFGWGFYWGDYWGPSYGWWYPYHSYWAYHYWYPWWDYNHQWWGCDRDWYACNRGYRSAYAERSLVKRQFLDYGVTDRNLRRTRALADSRLVKTRTQNVAQRLERSSLQRRGLDRTVDRASLLRSERSSAASRDAARKIIYGRDRTTRATRRDAERTMRPREAIRGTEGSRTVAPRSGRGERERTTPSVRGRSGAERGRETQRDVIRRAAPQRKSSDRSREVAPRSNPRNEERSRSTVDRRRASSSEPGGSGRASSVRGASSPSRSSAPARSSVSPSRSSGRSSSSSPAPARSSSGGSSGRTRSR